MLLRTVEAVGVVVITAAFALAIPRWARPDLYPDETGVGGTLHAMERAFFHLDFGVACGWAGCPPVREMWARGYVADISMLFGSVVIGIGSGFLLGLWCAGRPGRRRTRIVEGTATLLYCAPVYVIGWAILLLFHGTFGLVPLPYFFDAAPVWASPFQDPSDWFRTMLIPWLVAAAPLAHAATASLVGVSAPVVVLNLILVEHLFSVPGFFLHTWRASGHTDMPGRWPSFIDYEMLVGIAVWGSVFVVVLSLAMEFALLRLDPRVRSARGI